MNNFYNMGPHNAGVLQRFGGGLGLSQPQGVPLNMANNPQFQQSLMNLMSGTPRQFVAPQPIHPRGIVTPPKPMAPITPASPVIGKQVMPRGYELGMTQDQINALGK